MVALLRVLLRRFPAGRLRPAVPVVPMAAPVPPVRPAPRLVLLAACLPLLLPGAAPGAAAAAGHWCGSARASFRGPLSREQ